MNHMDIISLAEQLIHQQYTMTIGTARDGTPWCAPVYYVFIRPDFFFLSSPSSRHIKEALSSGNASCSIHADSSTWEDIRGIQMSGTIKRVSLNKEALFAFNEYIKKFPLTKDLFHPGKRLTLKNLLKHFRVRFYRFTPELVYYLDNSIEFGFRQEIDLNKYL